MMQLKKKLKMLGFDNYRDYLESPHWLKFKQRYYSGKRKRICEICSTEKQLNLHHVSYHHLGKERFIDVLPLCRPCHQNVHEYLANQKLPVSKTHLAVDYLKAMIASKAKNTNVMQSEPMFFPKQTPEFEKDLIRSGLSVQFDPCLLFGVGTRNAIPNSVAFTVGQQIGKILREYKSLPRKTKQVRQVCIARALKLLDYLEEKYNISLKGDKLLEKVFN